jgi:A/G-specific adenine glycosylase
MATARAWCVEKGGTLQKEEVFPTQRHTFSHYHLDYTALLIHWNNLDNCTIESDANLWYKLKRIDTLALPAPISRLLQVLYNERGIQNDTISELCKIG